MLSTDQYQKCIDYIKQAARPLEKALYRYHFEGGSKNDVLQELAAYQNEDGGFGNALEPDVRLADSSVLATIFAFQKFREIDAPAHHPMVKQAADYLIKTYDSKRKRWQLVPPNVDDSPHAPWWNHADETLYFCGGQCIEILAYLYDYPKIFPEELRVGLTKSLIERLEYYHSDIDEEDGTYLLSAYLKVLETPNLPNAVYTAILAPLTSMVKVTVQSKPEFFDDYGLTPLSFISSKNSPFFSRYENVIPQNIDYLVNTIHEDGYWAYNWEWAFASGEASAAAQKEFRGIHTLNNLLLFKEFGDM